MCTDLISIIFMISKYRKDAGERYKKDSTGGKNYSQLKTRQGAQSVELFKIKLIYDLIA